MAIIVKSTGSDTFTPAPEGVHRGVCIDVIDKGVVTTEWNGRKREVPKVVIGWALDVEREDGQPFFVDQWYTASLSQKATLRQHLETWRGKAFPPDELAGFDLEALIGVNCHVVVIHNHKDERTFANVKGITPLGKTGTKMEIPGATCAYGIGRRRMEDPRTIPDGRGKKKIPTTIYPSGKSPRTTSQHLRELRRRLSPAAKGGRSREAALSLRSSRRTSPVSPMIRKFDCSLNIEPVFRAALESVGLPRPAREYCFHPTRRWRFDYAFPESKVAVEVEGGAFIRGRHTRAQGSVPTWRNTRKQRPWAG